MTDAEAGLKIYRDNKWDGLLIAADCDYSNVWHRREHQTSVHTLLQRTQLENSICLTLTVMAHTSIQISAAYTGNAHNLQVTHVVVYNEFMSLHFKQFLSQAPSVLNVKPPTVMQSVRGIYGVRNWLMNWMWITMNCFVSIVLTMPLHQYCLCCCSQSCWSFYCTKTNMQYDQCSWIHKWTSLMNQLF